MVNASGVEWSRYKCAVLCLRLLLFVKDLGRVHIVHLRTFHILLPGSTLVALGCSFWFVGTLCYDLCNRTSINNYVIVIYP